MAIETSVKTPNPSGVYRHPDTGEELVCQATAKFGNPQADAFQRNGFVYVGPADPAKFAVVDPSAGPVANTSGTAKSVAELKAELAVAKANEQAATAAAEGGSELVAPVEELEPADEEAPKKASKKGAK